MTCAAYYGHTDVIKELIENGADVNLVRMDGTSPLWLAANAPDDGGEAAALELLEAGAKADIVGSRGGTALHGAAFHGRAKLGSSLIVAGCPVNAVNSKTSYTALHTAAETKHPKVGSGSQIRPCSPQVWVQFVRAGLGVRGSGGSLVQAWLCWQRPALYSPSHHVFFMLLAAGGQGAG
jgi:hypothetical protein